MQEKLTKNPLSDLAAECGLASSILLIPECLDRVEINPEWVEDELIRKIIKASIEMHKAGEAITLSSAANKAGLGEQSDIDRLKHIASDITRPDAKGFAVRVKNLYKLRQAKGAAVRLITSLQIANQEDSISILEEVASFLRADDTSNQAVLTQAEVIDIYCDSLKNNRGIRTGIEVFDLAEAFFPGDLIAIMARPRIGKSMFVQNIACNMAKLGQKVLFFSLEMPTRLIGEREMQIFYGLDRLVVRQRALDGSLNFAALMKEFDSLKFVTEGRPTVEEIKTVIRLQVDKPDIVIIDHLDYLKLSQKGNDADAIRDAYVSLKAMAKSTDVGMMVVHQARRGENNDGWRRPQLSEFRGSSGPEENADIAIGLWRPEEDPKLSATEKKSRRGIFCAYLMKSRQSGSFEWKMKFDTSTMRLTNYDNGVTNGKSPTRQATLPT